MEYICKYCGSKNLEIEETGNRIGLYCCDCGKWLKWITKEEKRVFLDEPQSNCIEIPEGATNGDVIKAMFPNAEYKDRHNITIDKRNSENGKLQLTGMADKEWWNAPYKKEVKNEQIDRCR